MEFVESLQLIDIGNNKVAVRGYDVMEDRFKCIMVLHKHQCVQVLKSDERYFFIQSDYCDRIKKNYYYVVYPDLSTARVCEIVCSMAENNLAMGEKPYLASIWKDDKGSFFAYLRFKSNKYPCYVIKKIEEKDFEINGNDVRLLGFNFTCYKDEE